MPTKRISISDAIEPLLFDSPRAAEMVGVSVGVLRGWVSQGLPYVRAGRAGAKCSLAATWKSLWNGRKNGTGNR